MWLNVFVDLLAVGGLGNGAGRQEEGPEEGEKVQQVQGEPAEEQQKVQHPADRQRPVGQDIRDDGEAQGGLFRHTAAQRPERG